MIPGWGPTHQDFQLRLNEDGTWIEENSMIPKKDTSIQNEHRGCGFGMYNASAVFIRKHVTRLAHICFIEKRCRDSRYLAIPWRLIIPRAFLLWERQVQGGLFPFLSTSGRWRTR